MKKIKFIISILALSLVFVACDQIAPAKKTKTDEENLETVDDNTKDETETEEDEKSEKDTTEEKQEESQEDNKDENNQENIEEVQNQEDNKTEDDKEEKQETKSEETQTNDDSEKKDDKKTDPSNQIEIKDDHKGDDEVVATVDVTPSDLKEFNTEMTKELQKAVSEKSASLVYGNNIAHDLFPADKLQAVAKFKDDVSSGYVVRYGVNKIGLLYRLDEAPEDIGYNIHDGAAILNQTEDIIKNDYPSEYKELVQNLVNGLNQGEAKIEFAY